jgi:outer membrane protein assembly factor BamE
MLPFVLMRRHPALILALLAPLLPACSSLQSSDNVLGFITPYRIDIVQGNVVTKEQMALVKVGQSRAQVRDELGSPLLTDVFHADRWDYVFTIKRQGAEPQQRTITLRFDGEQLKSIEAPELPSEREFVASIDTFKRKNEPGPLALTPEQLNALPIPPKVAPAPEEPVGPVRDYPPLEPKT